MNIMSRLNWLRGARQPAPTTQFPDAADMGTAFGLDASLLDTPDAKPSTSKQPTDTDAPRLSRRTGLPRRD